MNCMKCDRLIAADQVFCEQCLEEMARYPVNPNTPVILPHREEAQVVKRSTSFKRTRKPEEKVSALKKAVIWLSVAVVVLVISLSLLVTAMVRMILDAKNTQPPGQNYGTTGQQQPSDE